MLISVALMTITVLSLLFIIFQACESFKEISRKLYDKCNCIEELSDMREWMKGIPDKLKEHQVNIKYSKLYIGEIGN